MNKIKRGRLKLSNVRLKKEIYCQCLRMKAWKKAIAKSLFSGGSIKQGYLFLRDFF